MVKLRLKRMGSKRKPYYRIVAADSRFPRDGRIIETIGSYNPTKNPAEVKVDTELALNWLQKGAQPSDTVRNILSKAGVMKQLHEAKNATGYIMVPCILTLYVHSVQSRCYETAARSEKRKIIWLITRKRYWIWFVLSLMTKIHCP